MSGQRATDHDPGAAGAPASSRRVRVIAGLAGVSRSPSVAPSPRRPSDPGSGGQATAASKAAAAAPTSAPTTAATPCRPTTSATIPSSTRSPSRASTATSSPAITCSCSRRSTPTTRRTATRAAAARTPGTGRYCGLETGGAEPPSGEPVPPEGLGADPALDALASRVTPATWRPATSCTAAPSRDPPTRTTATPAPGASRRTPAATARRWKTRSPAPGWCRRRGPATPPTTVADVADRRTVVVDHVDRVDDGAGRHRASRPG